MAVKAKTKKGKTITLLNPAEKGRKFAAELRANMHATNDQQIKRDKNGKPKRLTKTEKAYRSGYLDSRKDGAKVYNAQSKKKNANVIDFEGPINFVSDSDAKPMCLNNEVHSNSFAKNKQNSKKGGF